jgi:uncharacterized protein YdaU (DUF1376 family)
MNMNRLVEELRLQSRELSLLALGAYAALLVEYEYSGQGSLDAERALALGHSDEEREALSFALREFFRDPAHPDGYRHAALDQELARREAIRQKRVYAGRQRHKNSAGLAPAAPVQACADHASAHAGPEDRPEDRAPAELPAAHAEIFLRRAQTVSVRRDQATRIPEDFRVTEALRQWARREGLPDPDLHVEHFVDYWQAAAGGNARKCNWDAAFRNWLRKEQTPNFLRGNGHGQNQLPRLPQPTAQHARWHNNKAEYDRIHGAGAFDKWLRSFSPGKQLGGDADHDGAGHAPRFGPGNHRLLEAKTEGNS